MSAWATTIISGLVLVVAFMQWRTAHQKVVLDLFERRLHVYELLEEAALEFEASPRKDDLPLKNAREALAKGKFLFGAEVFSKISQFYNLLKRYEPIPPEVAIYQSEEGRFHTMSQSNEAIMAEVKQFRFDMPNTFERYLRLDQKLVRTPFQWFQDRNRIRVSYADEKQK